MGCINVGSIRRECVDHIVVLGEAHLRRILRTYARYYNDIRTLSLSNWSLCPRHQDWDLYECKPDT